MMKDLGQWIDRNLEPSEGIVLAYDWEGNEIYKGESYLILGDDQIKDDPDKIKEYLLSHKELALELFMDSEYFIDIITTESEVVHTW